MSFCAFRRQLDRQLFAKARLDEVGIGNRQGILGRQILVDPLRSRFFRLEEAEVGNKLIPQGFRLLRALGFSTKDERLPLAGSL
jgi:hypothetical protein